MTNSPRLSNKTNYILVPQNSKLAKRNDPDVFSLMKPIVLVIFFVINIYVLMNVLKMQQTNYACKCAQIPNLKKISNTLIIIISLQVIMFILAVVIKTNEAHFTRHFIRMLSFILFVVQLYFIFYYIYMVITFIYNLDSNNCICVNPHFKTFLTYYTGFTVGVILLLIIAMITVATISFNLLFDKYIV
jgi:hypothetical protein